VQEEIDALLRLRLLGVIGHRLGIGQGAAEARARADQVPDQKSIGTPGSAPLIADLSAADVDCASPLPNGPFATMEFPGAFTRSCRTACGRACPANTASAAATAAATSVVRAAAAITTQCAAIRRAGSGPRGANTHQRIPYNRKPWQFP
jgi:hypothetical protein